MANFVPVRKDQHQNLKLAATRDLSHVAKQHIVPITAAEFSQASASFPVVVVKDPESSRFRSVVMLGLESGENVFYGEASWNALYVPLSVGVVPFSLGLDPEKEKTLTACIDLDSPLVGEDKDVPLFEENGDEAEVLKNFQKSLARLYDNEVMTEKFLKVMADHDLFQEVELIMTSNNGEKKKLVGIYTINESKVKELADDVVLDFHKRGLFVPIYAMLGSLGQLNRLVKHRNLTSEVKINGIQITPVGNEEQK